MMLSSEQKQFFDTFGFLSFPGLMRDRVGEIIEDFEEIWKRTGGGHHGKAHDGQKRSCLVPFLDQHEGLCGLLDDPRIHGIGCALLGDDFNYMGSDGNYYTGDTGWHSDGRHEQERHIKIAFYLDRLTRNTGCLRVIPGSHKLGDQFEMDLETNLRHSMETWGVPGSDIPAWALEIEPGDVVVFNHNLKHASFGGNSWRRMFTINLSQRYAPDRLPVLQKYIEGSARFWLERVYGPTMIQTATAQRKRHLEQVMANDGHLAALSQAHRMRSAEPSRG